MKVSLANPAVYDLQSGNLDPYSMRPVGDRWKASTAYSVGEVITPNTGTTGNGHTYRCTTAGTSGATQPSFPTGTGQTVGDGSVVWTENTATMASSGTVGNTCTGQRYMVVLFKNRNGYITGMTEASVQGFNVVNSAQQLTVTSIPQGPPNTAARILCFTVAGGTSVGDYFYIPSQDSVSGITMSSTVINDNTTTSVTLNFTDIYLLSTTKVTAFSARFRRRHVWTSIILRRSTGWCSPMQPAIWFPCLPTPRVFTATPARCSPVSSTAKTPSAGATFAAPATH